MPITLNGDTGIQTPMYNGTITANAVTPSVNMKNRIINGAMNVSQRGATNVTAGGGSLYVAADRFSVFNFFGSGQINTAINTSIVPSGYSYSLGLTVGTAVPLNGSTGYLVNVAQTIEGFNIADAYNQTVTISFWVRSSITGTYSVSLYNASNAGATSASRLYVASYTINSANTWEQKTVTVNLSSGTASGTWDTGNGVGLTVAFGLGAESNRKGNTFLNTWGTVGTTYEFQAASQVNWASTNGATFYITGVQLEVGTNATFFDARSYGTELALCQRYYQIVALNLYNGNPGAGEYHSVPVPYFSQMRATPTAGTISGGSSTNIIFTGIESLTSFGCRFTIQAGTSADAGYVGGQVPLSSEL